MKLDNLDSRDVRQLNQLYVEVKRMDGEGAGPSGRRKELQVSAEEARELG